MKLVVKKRDVTDLEEMQGLVVEHVDGIEPDLTMLDSRLLLGHATIDVVALDGHGALVLMAVGFTADEEMLLKAVEAYSWCLEYPEAIRRLYPSAEFSVSRPPRMVFVIERMPDAFHRKIKQLGFPEVDCVEFRHLDVNGVPVVYFETLARLRRGGATTDVLPRREAVTATERATPPAATNGRATSPRLQKLAHAAAETARAVERPGPARETGQVLSMLTRASAAPRPEPVAALHMETEGAGALGTLVEDEEPVVEARAAAEPLTEVLEQAAAPVIEPTAPVSLAAVLAAEPAVEPAVQTEEPRVSFAEAAKGLLGGPGAAAPAAATEADVAQALPKGFEGLKLPNDGVLTRQWMEFLNQMATTK